MRTYEILRHSFHLKTHRNGVYLNPTENVNRKWITILSLTKEGFLCSFNSFKRVLFSNTHLMLIFFKLFIFNWFCFISAICITGCLNGGTCTSPNTCSCPLGQYTGPSCDQRKVFFSISCVIYLIFIIIRSRKLTTPTNKVRTYILFN